MAGIHLQHRRHFQRYQRLDLPRREVRHADRPRQVLPQRELEAAEGRDDPVHVRRARLRRRVPGAADRVAARERADVPGTVDEDQQACE